jgi:hypothetical protein
VVWRRGEKHRYLGVHVFAVDESSGSGQGGAEAPMRVEANLGLRGRGLLRHPPSGGGYGFLEKFDELRKFHDSTRS